jgi:hypothetical protein
MAEILCFKGGSKVSPVLKFAFLLDTVLIRRPGLCLLQFLWTETLTNSDCFEPVLAEATWSLQETSSNRTALLQRSVATILAQVNEANCNFSPVRSFIPLGPNERFKRKYLIQGSSKSKTSLMSTNLGYNTSTLHSTGLWGLLHLVRLVYKLSSLASGIYSPTAHIQV